MILLSHFPVVGVSNTYIVGPEKGGDAVLIDPGRFDVTLLEMIENHDFEIKSVFVTHAHDNHIQGLRTLKKIYDAQIYYAGNTLLGFPTTPLNDGDTLTISGFPASVMSIDGHSTDSRVLRLENLLFTGDILSAGRIGTSATAWGRENLITEIRHRLLSLGDDLLVLPGHGPPTTLKAEQKNNPDIINSSSSK